MKQRSDHPPRSNKRNLSPKRPAVLNAGQHQFVSFLPRRLSWIPSTILKSFFSGVKIDPHQLERFEQVPDDAIIIYVNKFKSKFDFLFFHTRYAQMGLKSPEIGFEYRILFWQPVSRLLKVALANIQYVLRHFSIPNPYRNGYYKEALLNDHVGFLSLVEKGGVHRRFVKAKRDPIRYIIELQKSIDRPIVLIPQLVFFGKNPTRSIPTLTDIFFGPESRPGILRRLTTLFRTPGKVFVEISKPLDMKKFLDSESVRDKTMELQGLTLRRRLLLQINRHRQSITGPVLKSREELKEGILTNERFQTFMKSHSESRNLTIHQVRQKAETYLREIAAQYSPGFIRMASGGVRWIMNSMFDGFVVNEDGLNKVKTVAQDAPLILIPCHKSHIDYLILSYVLYHHNLVPPHVAAGKNLSFWPLGPIFRRGGAFFIRRTFRGAVLYSKVFTEYLNKLLQEGFNIEFFIEGTRSRTGKLFLPKLGLLSMLFDAYRNGACEDMIFVPIYIGYDRVIEEGSYLRELEGGQKEPESILQIVKARKFLKKRYGKIYIQFNAPLSLKALLHQNAIDIATMTSKQKNQFVRKLGLQVANDIDKATVVTAHGLVAASILNCPKPRFSKTYLKTIAEFYIRYLAAHDTKLADTLIIDQDSAIDNAIESYIQRKYVELVSKEKETTAKELEYRVNESKRPGLEYYKNNSISLFIPAVFTAIEILHRDAFQFTASDLHAGYAFLHELFKNEFAHDQELSTERLVRKSIKVFIDDAILIPHQTLPDTYNMTSAGLRKLKLFAIFLKSYFESYLVVLNFFGKQSKNGMDNKDRLKHIENLGKRMYKYNDIERKEALSKVSYRNAIDFFNSKGIRGIEDEQKMMEYVHQINSYLNRL